MEVIVCVLVISPNMPLGKKTSYVLNVDDGDKATIIYKIIYSKKA